MDSLSKHDRDHDHDHHDHHHRHSTLFKTHTSTTGANDVHSYHHHHHLLRQPQHTRAVLPRQLARAFRVAWLLEQLSLPYTLLTYRRLSGKRAEPTLRTDSCNPLGKSPYLIDADGTRVGESSAIVSYLIERYAPQSLLLGKREDWQERAAVAAWVSFSEGMMTHTLAVVYTRWFSDGDGAKEVERKMAGNVHNNLDHLEAALAKAEGEAWPVGGRLTAADVMCAFSAEHTFGMDIAISAVGKSKADWPNTVEWLKRCARLPSYQRVLEKGVTHRFTITD